MSSPIKPGSFSTFFAEGQYETQTEMLEVAEKSRKLTIGIPLETTLQENRVAIVPNSIRILKGYGHDVLVESGAGNAPFAQEPVTSAFGRAYFRWQPACRWPRPAFFTWMRACRQSTNPSQSVPRSIDLSIHRSDHSGWNL